MGTSICKAGFSIQTSPAPQPVDLGRDICGDLHAAERREWLVANGIGGFASGTIAGSLTRRYHGLLTAALKPPLGRTLVVAKLDEAVHYNGETFHIATNRWADGAVDPQGYRLIERFYLQGTVPVWIYAFSDVRLEKRIWMEPGENTTYVRYAVLQGSGPLTLNVKALVNYRDYHWTTTQPHASLSIEVGGPGVVVTAGQNSTPFYLFGSSGTFEPASMWNFNFDLPAERERGLPDREHHLHAGTWRVTLEPGEQMTWVATMERPISLKGIGRLEHIQIHELTVMEHYATLHSQEDTPPWIHQLILAADQFIASRPLEGGQTGHTIMAGYHWFGDWGRDTMISLPGLTLTTGRLDVASSILRTFARFADQGMLPNRFPDAGEKPEYNTVDATLWFFEAIREYVYRTRDTDLLKDPFPVLVDIIQWHQKGTRFCIHMDAADGLLFAGEPGAQLTWMDAKVGNWVVTPRIGKPVEVNALWLNALATMKQFAKLLKKPAHEYEVMADRVRNSFQRFWNEASGMCFDVIDGPEGHDPSPRPNQLFTVSLPESPFRPQQRKAIVDYCAKQLMTSFGLRSLAPSHPQYVGQYGGGPHQRDGAYHQGTVWGWLIGPFVIAHLKTYHNPELALSFLRPFAHHLSDLGLGTVGEIFDGDPPFNPRGCIAQAWTVAEILRAWEAIQAVTNRGTAKTNRQSKSSEV